MTVNDGNGGANYLVTYHNNTASTITPRSITYYESIATKTYDGTASATAIGDIAFAGDQLALALGAATFATPGAGNGKTITDAANQLRGSV